MLLETIKWIKKCSSSGFLSQIQTTSISSGGDSPLYIHTLVAKLITSTSSSHTLPGKFFNVSRREDANSSVQLSLPPAVILFLVNCYDVT